MVITMSSEDHNMYQTPSRNTNSIVKLRKIVKLYIDANANECALFWADKVVTMSNEDPRDVYLLAQCMYRCKQYHRAVTLIKNKCLDKTQPICQWLAALCLLEAGDYHDALHMLTGENENTLGRSNPMNVNSRSSLSSHTLVESNCFLEGFTPSKLISTIELVKGRIYEKLEYRSRAVECFKQALINDIYCYEAFQALVQNQMLSESEEQELILSLSESGQNKLVISIYSELLNKYQKIPDCRTDTCLLDPTLKENLDLKLAKAEKLYYTCAYRKCLRLTEEILERDPYHLKCLSLYISCLVEENKTNRLFGLAHELVKLMPDRAVSWFAVGCYYYTIKKSDEVRKYLAKALSLNKYFGPAWLVYGHSFAEENEHDQAMVIYFTASKILKGCHLPLLYAGTASVFTNNAKVSGRFLNQAYSIAPLDPFTIHEVAVNYFENHDYRNAEEHFLLALSKVQKTNESYIHEKWEPLLINLGHTYRKMKKYDKSLKYYQQALVLSSQNPSTFTNIGFVQALQGNLLGAVDTFHKVLGLVPGDLFSTAMLSYIIEEVVETSTVLHLGKM